MPNTVELIPQDKSNACWLASSSMMETWRTGTHHSLSDTLKVLDASGTSFSTIYNNDQGLSFANDNIITQTLGLTQLPPASYTIEYLTSILDQSPLMAVIMYASTSNIAHMIIITGISGDGTPQGTSLQINDPLPLNAGKTYTIAFNDFLTKFEQVVAYENNWPNTDLTSQYFILPAQPVHQIPQLIYSPVRQRIHQAAARMKLQTNPLTIRIQITQPIRQPPVRKRMTQRILQLMIPQTIIEMNFNKK
jgi:hypothetical protein